MPEDPELVEAAPTVHTSDEPPQSSATAWDPSTRFVIEDIVGATRRCGKWMATIQVKWQGYPDATKEALEGHVADAASRGA